jgi:hypothetical protein
MKHSITFLLFFLLLSAAQGQNPFNKRLYYGTNALQEARRIIRTPDNNFLVVGYTASSTSASSLDRDALVLKINASGAVIWAKKYGGSDWEEFNDVVQVGNYYYCVGYTRTPAWVNGTYMSGIQNLNADVFLVKLRLDGSVVWAKNMGKPANGINATDGNDIGQRIVASNQGGVILTVRINSGASTGQNNGIIWVDSDGKTKWAYQYDMPGNPSINELTLGIWKDNTGSYITGGWIGPASTGFTGGIIFKVNQKGDLVWAKNTRCNPSNFESQYYGYYNHNTGKVYTTDYYSQTGGSNREPQVCTNMANTGNAPTGGGIPKAKRFYYGSPGSSSNNYRGNIFPVGDGYQQFILAAYELNAVTGSSTKYATIISVDEDLNFQWAKKVGATHQGATGYLNQIFDIVTCDGNNQSLLTVGTISKSNGNKDILIARIRASGTLDSCDVSAPIVGDTIGETANSLNLQRVNLNTVNCGNSCWADNDLISSITVSDITLTSIAECTPISVPDDELISEVVAKSTDLDHIVPTTTGGVGIAGLTGDLSFNFLKSPKEIYFEITDPTGDFVYERFFSNMDKLTAGFDFASMKLEKGDYIWEIEAVYDGEEGIERKVGQFTID